MDLSFSAAEGAFRDEVQNFVRDSLPDDIAGKVSLGRPLDRDDLVGWQKILHDRGWAAPHWPAEYGGPGRGDGQFHRPASVVVDGEGYIYVADWGNERVQVLDPDGGFVMKLRGQATLSRWAQEFLDTNVEEAEARGRSNLEPDLDFGGDSHEESAHIEKYFWAPSSVKLDGDGRLYVTESNRHRIQVFVRKV